MSPLLFPILADSSVWPLAMFPCVLLIMGAMIAFAFYREKKRTEALHLAAEELKLNFDPTGAAANFTQLTRFPLLNGRRSARARNAIHGNAQGIEVRLFDFSYTSGGRKSRSTRHMSVAHLRSAQLALPKFSLTPEGLLTKIGTAFGMQDIDFPEQPDFSSAFLLRGGDEAGVRRLFDDALLASLTALKGISIEGEGGDLIILRQNNRVAPEAIRGFFEEAFRAFCLFADAVQRTQRK